MSWISDGCVITVYIHPSRIRTSRKQWWGLPEWLAGLPGASSFSVSCSVSFWEKTKTQKICPSSTVFSINGVTAVKLNIFFLESNQFKIHTPQNILSSHLFLSSSFGLRYIRRFFLFHPPQKKHISFQSSFFLYINQNTKKAKFNGQPGKY